MNKTLKRRVFRHTALYAAILMFSHTGGGGGGAVPHTLSTPFFDKRGKPHRSTVKWSISKKEKTNKGGHNQQQPKARKHLLYIQNNRYFFSSTTRHSVFGHALSLS
ncbi:hypothetical protein M5Z91_10895, partial [Neisseria meningitidis]|nr:hypothetical protein [Neisseria meningitidis]